MLVSPRILGSQLWRCTSPLVVRFTKEPNLNAELSLLLLTRTTLCRAASWYEKVMRVNVVGPYLVTRTFLPLLLKRNTRTVVQISSGLGSITRNRLGMTEPEKNPIGNAFIAYNSSKAALNMRKYMATEAT